MIEKLKDLYRWRQNDRDATTALDGCDHWAISLLPNVFTEKLLLHRADGRLFLAYVFSFVLCCVDVIVYSVLWVVARVYDTVLTGVSVAEDWLRKYFADNIALKTKKASKWAERITFN